MQNVNVQDIDTEVIQTTMLQVSAKIQTTEHAIENLSKLMIGITTWTSVAFCNEVSQILGRNTSVLQSLLSKCRRNENVLNYQKIYSTSQLSLEGFQRTELTTSGNHLKYEHYWKAPTEVISYPLRDISSAELYLRRSAIDVPSHSRNIELVEKQSSLLKNASKIEKPKM